MLISTQELVHEILLGAGPTGVTGREMSELVGGIAPGTAKMYLQRAVKSGLAIGELEQTPGYPDTLRTRYWSVESGGREA